jgi:hypothetical protein
LACPYSIRDSSFISGDGPTTFRLCLLTTSGAPERGRLDDAVQVATTTWLAASNVVVEIVDVDRSVKHELEGAIPGRLLDPAAAPAAVLISPRHDAIQLDLPDGSLSDGSLSDAVMDLAVRVIDSPVRSRLAEHWPTAWCALIVVTGDDPAQNQVAFAAANDAATRIHGTLTEMDKLVEYAPEVIVIPHDSREERLVLWSLGLGGDSAEDAATEPRVAMLVGRGELRGPVLSGVEITAEKVYESLEMLGRSCSCTTDSDWLSGPVLPIEWTDEMQAKVVAQLDFDPNDPTAAGAIRDVMSGLDQVFGYQEFTLGYREMNTPGAEKPVRDVPVATTTVERRDDIAVNPSDGLLYHRNRTTGYREISNPREVAKFAAVDAGLSKAATSPATDADEASDHDVAVEATAVDPANEAVDMNSAPDDNGRRVVVWDSALMMILLGAVVLILGIGTALMWGRSGH